MPFASIKRVFLLHPHDNQSKFLGQQGLIEILMITLVSSPRGLGPTLMQRTVRTDKIVCSLEHNGILLKIICKGSMEPINRNSLIICCYTT